MLGRLRRALGRALGRALAPLRSLARRGRRPLRFAAAHRRPLLAVALTTAAGLALMVILLDGGGDDEGLSGGAREVVAAMDQFERAARARDYARICNELFTIEAREAAGGDDCPALLEQSTDGVREVDVRLESIVVRGNSASARVNARARGQAPATDTVRFVRREGRFRIASLSP